MKLLFSLTHLLGAVDLRTLFGSGLGVIMALAFIIGVVLIISGAWQIKQGNADQGKLSIIGGVIIAAAVSIMAFFYAAAELDGSAIDPNGL
ncbi:MAG: hypothetical protein NE328_10185 [Lentisphaeraceae bacterium]|nr:hypothetical protein [Lentisphaeraceae bacterium]